jgi:hypothetical protein
MEAAIVLFLLAAPAFAQNKSTDPAIAPGCGTDNARFEVTTWLIKTSCLLSFDKGIC